MSADAPSPGRRWPDIPPMSAGLRCRCPRCGQGKVFAGLLTVAPRCTVCGLDLSQHDTGDGPAVFAIFLLGFIVVPLALLLEAYAAPATWVHLVVWPPVVIALAIAMLRPMKATLIAYHYKNLPHSFDG